MTCADRICAHAKCGKLFTPRSALQRCCSASCRSRLSEKTKLMLIVTEGASVERWLRDVMRNECAMAWEKPARARMWA